MMPPQVVRGLLAWIRIGHPRFEKSGPCAGNSPNAELAEYLCMSGVAFRLPVRETAAAAGPDRSQDAQ
jgi:hypothetical protein